MEDNTSFGANWQWRIIIHLTKKTCCPDPPRGDRLTARKNSSRKRVHKSFKQIRFSIFTFISFFFIQDLHWRILKIWMVCKFAWNIWSIHLSLAFVYVYSREFPGTNFCSLVNFNVWHLKLTCLFFQDLHQRICKIRMVWELCIKQSIYFQSYCLSKSFNGQLLNAISKIIRFVFQDLLWRIFKIRKIWRALTNLFIHPVQTCLCTNALLPMY